MKSIIKKAVEVVREAAEGGTPVRDAIAVLAAIATWLLSVGVVWEILIPHFTAGNAGSLAVIIAIIPAAMMWLAVTVVTEVKGWY